MSSDETERMALIEDLMAEGRRNTTSAVLFHHVIAERLNLNPTDHKCVDIIIQRGTMTAGQLAELTGLTTGSITTALDRLEAAGFVKRIVDPQDRRKVLLKVIPERFPEVEALFSSFLEAQAQLLERYGDDQLKVILDFLGATTNLYDVQAVKLRKQAPSRKQK